MKLLEGTGKFPFSIWVDVGKIMLDGVVIWEEVTELPPIEPTLLPPIYKLVEELVNE